MRSTKHKLSVFPNRQWEDLFFPLLQASLWQPITNWCESILKTKISQFPLFNFINSRFHTKVIFFSKAYKEIVIQPHMRIYYGYTSLSRKKSTATNHFFLHNAIVILHDLSFNRLTHKKVVWWKNVLFLFSPRGAGISSWKIEMETYLVSLL